MDEEATMVPAVTGRGVVLGVPLSRGDKVGSRALLSSGMSVRLLSLTTLVLLVRRLGTALALRGLFLSEAVLYRVAATGE